MVNRPYHSIIKRKEGLIFMQVYEPSSHHTVWYFYMKIVKKWLTSTHTHAMRLSLEAFGVKLHPKRNFFSFSLIQLNEHRKKSWNEFENYEGETFYHLALLINLMFNFDDVIIGGGRLVWLNHVFLFCITRISGAISLNGNWILCYSVRGRS